MKSLKYIFFFSSFGLMPLCVSKRPKKPKIVSSKKPEDGPLSKRLQGRPQNQPSQPKPQPRKPEKPQNVPPKKPKGVVGETTKTPQVVRSEESTLFKENSLENLTINDAKFLAEKTLSRSEFRNLPKASPVERSRKNKWEMLKLNQKNKDGKTK